MAGLCKFACSDTPQTYVSVSQKAVLRCITSNFEHSCSRSGRKVGPWPQRLGHMEGCMIEGSLHTRFLMDFATNMPAFSTASPTKTNLRGTNCKYCDADCETKTCDLCAMVKKGESLHQCPEKDSDSDPGDIQIMNPWKSHPEHVFAYIHTYTETYKLPQKLIFVSSCESG